MRPEAVGQPARVLAERAGFSVPEPTRMLVAECTGVGPEHPLSHEILMPVLTLYRCGSYDEAFDTCRAVTLRGGVATPLSCTRTTAASSRTSRGWTRRGSW